MKSAIRRVAYYPLGVVPLTFGIALSKRAYDQEMKRLKIKRPLPFMVGSAAAMCHTYEYASDVIVIVAFDATKKHKRSMAQILGLLIHESAYVWQACLAAMNDKGGPSKEFEAYAIQRISMCCIQAYFDAVGAKWRSKSKAF